MSISPGSVLQPPPPEHKPTYAAPAQHVNWFAPVVIIVLVVLAVANFLVFSSLSDTRKSLEQQLADLKERSSVLERKLAVSDERHNSLAGEVKMAHQKLGTTEKDLERARSMAKQLGQEQKVAEAKLSQQVGQVGQQVGQLRDEATQKISAVNNEVSGAKTDIAATRKDLEQTKIQLTSAIGDITKANTLIARNHDELGELRRRGERNYEEFTVTKKEKQHRVGDIAIQLKNADPKRQKYSVVLVAGDTNNEKKDRTANEPVQFYMPNHVLYQLVVNKVGKDTITGYLETPKQ